MEILILSILFEILVLLSCVNYCHSIRNMSIVREKNKIIFMKNGGYMVNFVLILIIGTILGGAIGYIIKEKKKGAKCIGCPDSKACGGKCK